MRDKDEKLLSAYFDSELSEADEARCEALSQADEQLRSLRYVRKEYCSWFHSLNSGAAGDAQTVDLWQKIAPELREFEERPRGIARFFRPIFVTPALGLATAAVIGFVLIGPVGEKGIAPAGRATTQLALRQEPPPVQSPPIQIAKEKPVSEDLLVNVAVNRRGRALSKRRNAARRVRLRMPPLQFAQARGYRASGTDIDWVRSDRSVHIVPSQQRNTPPIIWVGASTH